ncbi:hypothetical protein BKI52_41205 [marine bacterium AO1-C]|nr:hypothetical protein BKI52_41205 [marine bacterium AO1-C]
MIDLRQVMPLLKTNKPLDILKKIISYNDRAGSDKKLITVRVTLTKAVVIEGAPVKIDKDNQVIFLIQEKSLAYFNSSELIIINILNPEQVLDILTDGSFFEVPIDKVPSSLELKRIFNEIQEQFKETYGVALKNTFWNANQHTNNAKYQYHQLLTALSKSLNDIAKDDMGMQALQKIDDFYIESTDQDFFVTKAPQGLKLNIDFDAKFPPDFEQQLTTMIEQNL